MLTLSAVSLRLFLEPLCSAALLILVLVALADVAAAVDVASDEVVEFALRISESFPDLL